MAKLKLSRRSALTALAVAAACALILAFLVGSTALDKDAGPWAKAFLFLLGVIAVLAALFASSDAPVDARRWTAWLKPQPIALLFMAIFAAFGTMTDALSLFAPRPAVESEPGAIEKGVKEIRAAVIPRPVATPRVRLKLPGTWGEPGCAVTYRFRIRDGALIVDALRRPPGAPPYRLVATIVGADRDVLHAVGEQPEAARGRAATFTYVMNGVTERLTWDDQSGPVPLELDRCG